MQIKKSWLQPSTLVPNKWLMSVTIWFCCLSDLRCLDQNYLTLVFFQSESIFGYRLCGIYISCGSCWRVFISMTISCLCKYKPFFAYWCFTLCRTEAVYHIFFMSTYIFPRDWQLNFSTSWNDPFVSRVCSFYSCLRYKIQCRQPKQQTLRFKCSVYFAPYFGEIFE